MRLEKETSIYQLGAIAAEIGAATTLANSKNKIFYQDTAPATGMNEGDLWFKVDSSGGSSLYEYKKTGSNPNTYAWTLRQLGQGSLVAGSVTANEISVNDLSAISANLGSVIVGGLNNEDGVITIKDASNQTIGYWDNTGINAQAGIIGPWTLGVNGLTYETEDPDDPSYVASSYGKEGFAVSNSDGGILGLGNCITCTEKSGALTSSGFEVLGSSYQSSHYANVFSIGRTSDSSGITAEINKTSGYVGIHLVDNTSNWSIDIGENRGTIEFRNGTDTPLITNIYNSSSYNILRNHNNGNISVSASGAGLYLGYENTTLINFMNGKASLVSGGAFSVVGQVVSSLTSGQAAVYASNGGASNRIFIYADSSNGQAGLYSYSADNTPRAILVRAHNSSVITTYGDWVFSNVVPWKTDIKGRPMISDSADGHRVSLLTSGASGQVGIQAQFGSTGTTYSIGYFNVAASDVRLKKNIDDSTVNALSLVNAIKVRKFDWKDGRHQNIGMVADELEELDKALAIGGGYTDDNEMSIKTVDTFYLVGYLVKAVQELSAEVSRLKGVA